MQAHIPPVSALTRLEPALKFTGEKRASYYAKAAAGLMPKPLKIGLRACAIPQRELEAVNAARIAGYSDDQIRELVARLHAERSGAAS